MSMMARFVAITADQLATIQDTPEMVGGVFALDAGLPSESPSNLQELAPPSATAYSASSSRLPALSDRPYSAAVKIAENRGYGPARYFVARRSPRSQVPSSRRARSGACTGASIARR